MTDKNNESTLLLRMNKEEQVSVLQEIGFTSVNENTPASDIAKYIRWAGGLLDLSFATIRIEDGVNVFFTAEEWNSLSANNRSKYLRIGVRIRADRRQFVIAKSDCTDDIGGRTFKWGGHTVRTFVALRITETVIKGFMKRQTESKILMLS